LPEHGRDFYRRVARADQDHYDEFMAMHKRDESVQDAAAETEI
jgi:hypothetical protein